MTEAALRTKVVELIQTPEWNKLPAERRVSLLNYVDGDVDTLFNILLNIQFELLYYKTSS